MNLIIDFPRTKGKKPPTLTTFKKSCRVILDDGISKRRQSFSDEFIEDLYYELFEDQLELKPEVVESLREAKSEIERGEYCTLEEAFQHLNPKCISNSPKKRAKIC